MWNKPSNRVNQPFGKEDVWQGYTDIQYEAIDALLLYLEEKLDIPRVFFDYDIPTSNNYDQEIINNSELKNYGYYYSPNDAVERSNAFMPYLEEFYGIISHHNPQAKYDTGPHFNINRLN